MKVVIYLPEAQKALLRMPSNTSARIRSKIAAYATNPASQANNVKALLDGSIRLQVGDWRVIMDNGAVLETVRVGPRGSVYK